MIVDAIRAERLYVLTHETIKDALRRRVEPILEGHNPELRRPRGLAVCPCGKGAPGDRPGGRATSAPADQTSGLARIDGTAFGAGKSDRGRARHGSTGVTWNWHPSAPVRC
jgi:hypothetical protein